MTNSTHYAIETTGLTKRYGKHLAVDNLSLKVPKGSVFAFLGRNGAGKTTTIRILLDLLDRTSGQAHVLGMDCVRDALKIKGRIGYVAEAQKMYDWMKVDEIVWFCKGFYPTILRHASCTEASKEVTSRAEANMMVCARMRHDHEKGGARGKPRRRADWY